MGSVERRLASGMDHEAAIHRLRWRTALLSLAVGVGMLVLKGSAYLYTGSVAILSDAMESVVHVGATLVMVFSMRLSLQPADEEHPYGHGRIEHFSVGFEGGMVVLAGLGIIWITTDKLIRGYEPTAMGWGFAAMCAAAVINLALGLYLRWVGRRARSQILVADGTHVLSDVWTSAGVAVGLLVVWLTDWLILDALVALAVAVYILIAGGFLVRDAFRGLLDSADVEVLHTVIQVLNEIRRPDWIDIHSLRCRHSGDDVHIDCHLVVPGERTVAEMHEQLDALEEAVLARLKGQGSVLVHLDYPSSDLSKDAYAAIYPTYGKPFDIPNCTRLTNVSPPTTLEPPEDAEHA